MGALDRVSQARSNLLAAHPYFGTLSLRLRLAEGEQYRTMATDGAVLGVNPTWVARKSDKDIRFWTAHEVLHCALLHPYRMQGWDPMEFNQAADYKVNSLLRQAGFELPDGALYDSAYEGLTVEQIAGQRRKNRPEGQPGGQGQEEQPTVSPPSPSPGDGGQQGQAGQTEQAGQGQSPAVQEMEWAAAAEHAAMVMRRAGMLPGDAARAAKAAQRTDQDWREVLREFVTDSMPADYSWCHPNRRFAWQGLILPGITREGMPRLGIAVDTSGSISQHDLNLFATAITEIVRDCRPEAVDVVYCDTAVSRSERFTPDDEIVLRGGGGGGTMFQPALDWFTNHEEGPPVAVLYLTDLDCCDSPVEPDYPVLWVATAYAYAVAPWGRTIRLSLTH